VQPVRAGFGARDHVSRSFPKGIERAVHAHIHEYEQGNRFNHDPVRPRKLLLHKQEIKRLIGKTQEKGLTLIPTRLYFNNGKAKVELGLAKGKKQYDKREDVKRRTAERDIERALRGN